MNKSQVEVTRTAVGVPSHWTAMCGYIERLTYTCSLLLSLTAVLTLAVPEQVTAQQITGVVVESGTQNAVRGVSIRALRMGDSTGTTTKSDREGRYRLALPTPGRYRLQFQAPGYYPFSPKVIDLPAASTVRVDASLTPLRAFSLDTVLVQGQPVPGYLQDFYQRRSQRMGGTFFTEQDIKNRWPATPLDLMPRIHGFNVTLDRDGGGYSIQNAYVSHRRCSPLVFLDGTYVGNTDVFDITMLNVENLAGVEAYSRPVQVPMEFNTTGSECGVLIYWTKR